MKLIDKNETLVPPEGYTLINANPDGAYFRITYFRDQENGLTSWVVIFLNDQGREVIRTECWRPSNADAPTPEPVKLNWWRRLMMDFKRGE